MHDYRGRKSSRRSRATPSRSSASTPCPRPATRCAWSRTTARPARRPPSAPTRLKARAPRPPGPAPRVPRGSRRLRPPGAQPRRQVRRRRLARGAIEDEIAKLPQGEVKVEIIGRGVGGITESDVMLAAASDAIVLGFNVRPVGEARQVAEREGVEIRPTRSSTARSRTCAPRWRACSSPRRSRRLRRPGRGPRHFRASRVGTIAGCYVTDGQGHRAAPSAASSATAPSSTPGEIQSLRRHQRRRPRGRLRLRVRHRAQGLRRRQGGRRDRGLRDQQRGAGARDHVAGGHGCLRRPAARAPAPPRGRGPEGQAQDDRLVEGTAPRAPRRRRRRGRPPGPPPARDPVGRR